MMCVAIEERPTLLTRLFILVTAIATGCTGAVGDVADDSGPGGGRAGGSGGAGGGAEGGQAGAEAALVPATPAVRLTREQYAYAVEDLLGVRLAADLSRLPTELLLDGFSGLASNLTVFSAHAEGYHELARTIAFAITPFDDFVARHTDCQKTTDVCRGAFVSALGRRLFRRPLDERERDTFGALFAKVNELGGDFARGARAVLQAMLQAPQFLYRIEAEGGAGARHVSGYEMASRLSFLLWASTPDDELLDAAASGALDSEEGVVERAMAMVKRSDRARRPSARFVRDLMRLDTLADPGTERDGLTPELRGELAEAVVAFYQNHVWEEQQPLAALFTARHAYLSPTMAGWLGLDAAGSGIRRYDTRSLPAPIGLLTQPGVMAGMADRDVGGMVARGLYMEETVFCGEATPPPPANIDLAANKDHLGEVSERAYSEDRLQRSDCRPCHARFEPLAYGFERFDGIGRYRTRDQHGNELRDDGWIPAAVVGEERRYRDLAEYMTLVSELPQVQQCLTRKQLEFALGQKLDDEERRPLVAAIHDAFVAAGGRYPDVISALVAHPAFRTRIEP